ncbi:MAG TPA: hopanoid biosynthesis-associated protein HpnK [Roseiarcus sp.]|nr:hopanoid biosynthesis-associated protein HpnK [Roseiarcus sp.]
MNCLVITADDFGLAREVNEAVEIGCSKGILSAASLMVSEAHAEDAVERARGLPGLRVGLHLALTDATPVLPAGQIPRLVDRGGRLRSDLVRFGVELAASSSARAQMRAEIEAQFVAFLATGLPLDHVNVHRHFHLHPFIAAMVIEIGARFGARALRVPREPPRVVHSPAVGGRIIEDLCARLLSLRARRAGVATPEAVFGLRWSGGVTRDRLRLLLESLPRGFCEIYLHPATSDAFPGHAPGYRYVQELGALLDPGNAEALRRSGRRLCGYQDVLASRGRSPFVEPTSRRSQVVQN